MQMKQTTFAANNGITLLVLVGHMQHIWLVTHPLLNEQKRLLRSEESEEKVVKYDWLQYLYVALLKCQHYISIIK